ncbi:MAG: glycosyltransferase, partial [Chloroflexi bacterium]|nr:glycosyltransferase [Chloroflexota bacterium]
LDALAARLPARRVFVCSDTVRRSQSRTTDYRKIAVISGGIELEHFDPGLIPAGTLRRELGLGPDTLVVACVARLQRWKGQHQLLEAAVRVMASHPEAHFVLVGGGLFGLEPEYEAVLRATARRAPAPGRIHFLGHRDDVPELLTDVDVLVQPTMSPEGLGLSVLEAMAMSIPVVATSLGGCEETVIHGITGYLVPPADVPALSDAIEMLLENAVLRKTMGAEGRRRVLQRFSGERMVREMEGVLERVVDES